MIVSKSSFEAALAELKAVPILAVDTETTGLHPWGGDSLFSIIIGNDQKQLYFNFQEYPDFDPEFVLDRALIPRLKEALLGKPLFMHNAKFDLAMLFNAGCELDPAMVHDTQVMARLVFNEHMKYSLDACAKRDLGVNKDDAVEKYIRKHKLWKWKDAKKKKKDKYYWKVPPKIIVPYGCRDVELTYRLGVFQRDSLAAQDPVRGPALAALEAGVTRVLFDMERGGVRVDQNMAASCLEVEKQILGEAAQKYTEISGVPFKDANRTHEAAFKKLGAEIRLTEKGNPSFTDDVLELLDHPLATALQNYRSSYKMAETYYANFLALSRTDSRLHPDIRQSGARTGRFSMSDPNLQNIPKKDDDDELGANRPIVRHCFVPDPDHFLVEIDYDAMEFRLMLDYAEERGLIEQIKGGLDPHQATANMTGLSRKAAKTLNFGLLYGMGKDKLAKKLGVSVAEAQAFKYQYFAKLPLVHGFIKQTQFAAATRGWLRNWMGRRFYFPNPEFAYKGANSVIQGGCSDIVRVAMVGAHKYLADKRSKILIQIHDSLLLSVHRDEMAYVPEAVRTIMASAYPYKFMPMTCSIEWSDKSWGHMLDWDKFPGNAGGHAARDSLQDSHRLASTQASSQLMVDQNSAGSALR